MYRLLVAVFLSQMLLCQASHARDRWVRVAQVQVPAGQDVIEFPDAWRWKGRFKAIRWQADRGTTFLEAWVISYSNCKTQSVPQVRARLKSNVTIVEQPDSFIDYMTLLVNKTTRARTFEIWGLQTDTGAAATRDAYPLRAGFLIGSQAARQVLYDCPNPQAYSNDQVQLVVAGGRIHLETLKVTYDTGQTQTIEIGADLAPGEKTDVLRLQGGRFRQLELTYKAGADLRDATRVDIELSSSPDLRARDGRDGPPQMHACNFPCGAPVACVSKTTCTPVMVFFGTNRQRRDLAERPGFGPERGEDLSLGRAIVTVPRYHGVGQVERPSYWSAIASGNLHLLWNNGEDPERHFTIPKNGIEIFASPELFAEALRSTFDASGDFSDHAFVYVHGFKVEFDDAVFRTAQMAYDLGVDRNNARIPFGMPFLFSWPARGGLLDYVTDKESAQLAETHLRTFLELVIAQSKAKYVHVVAHSMGNQPVLNVLSQLATTRPDLKFNQVILAAPDVDRKQFLAIAERVQSVAQGMTVYVSSRDEAMLASRRLHSGLPRAGDVPSDGPVVVHGVDTIDVSSLSTEVFTASHSKYAENSLLLRDIGALLRNGTRPPHARTPLLRPTTVNAQEFWVYRK